MELKIRKLDEIINKFGFVYNLIKRDENKCLYSQTNKLGKITSYEVFLTKVIDAKKAALYFAKLNGTEEKIIDHDLAETFPGNEEFGKRTWCYPNLEKAMIAFDSK